MGYPATTRMTIYPATSRIETITIAFGAGNCSFKALKDHLTVVVKTMTIIVTRVRECQQLSHQNVQQQLQS